MTVDLFTVDVGEKSLALLPRQRARDIAGLLGFAPPDCVRIATAVATLLRNAPLPPETPLIFQLSRDGEHDALLITIPVSSGDPVSLSAARRLVPDIRFQSSAPSTAIHLRKNLPRCFIEPLSVVAQRLSAQLPRAPASEFDTTALSAENDADFALLIAELDRHESTTTILTGELEETYRGVASLYAELEDRAQEIHKVVDLKSRFLSNITHEFRTPLNSIISLSRMLLERIDGDLAPEQEKQTRFINRAAHDLSDLVNDLLDLSKADAGKIEVFPTSVSVNELFATLRGLLRPLIDHNPAVSLVFEPPEPPVEIVTDERKLAQILRNLVSNALKYTPAGQVRVHARIDGPRVIFCVHDTGIGIPAEHHDKVFEEFHQVRNPLQQKTKGTGLGLALSRRLALLLGGNITLRSQVGQGSTFCVHLPRFIAPTDTAPTAPDSENPNAHVTTAEIRIRRLAAPLTALIIDASTEARHSLRALLQQFQVNVVEADTADSATALIREHRPALVFAEIVLPDVSGTHLISRLRDAFPAGALIVHSSQVFTEEEREVMQQHATALIRKGPASDSVYRTALIHAIAGARRKQSAA